MAGDTDEPSERLKEQPDGPLPMKRNSYQASGMLTPSERESLRAGLIEAGASAQRELAKLANQDRAAGKSDDTDADV